MTKIDTVERDEYRDELRKLLIPGQTIYTSTETTKSGTSYVSLFIARVEDRPGRAPMPYIHNITWMVAKATGDRLYDSPSGTGALRLGGCGYSKPFQAVYGLGRALYPDGVRCPGDLKSKPKCCSNDHVNGDAKGYSRAKGHVHSDAGYTFQQVEL